MNQELHEKYKDISLSPQLSQMYAEIILSDPAVLQVFTYIAEATWESRESEIGVMFNDLVKSVKINRKVMHKKSKFQEVHTNIERRHAERIVDKFLMMGLCYYRTFGQPKAFYITKRGKQVMVSISQIKKGADLTLDDQNNSHAEQPNS
ncbi:hypothetical protein AM501_23965 [Aneurinibacillus migulanus]|uniref:hypothetical protein n=1 Tax=Aneurinibacillus migulanus TaxID=47500 RepID=UPI0005BD661D|nr:hypothetical protein [Aneurinibacillus migulanus]KIV58935.1 hypothetical protein TS64_04015 [Aneurinibacillus migulanus]KPD05833.1 hypothetical protein AM501_23965 [Aneurinibacillus migulanus]